MKETLGQSRWDRVVSGSLTVAALALAVVLGHREFFGPPAGRPGNETPRYQSDWRQTLPAGRVVGDVDAPVMIAVVSDLECPFCKRFHASLQGVMEAYPLEVAYTFVHFPLPSHKHALSAARFAECASLAGRFSAALDFVFANQESLGLRDWDWFAREIGVQANADFRRCMEDPGTPGLIEKGLAEGARIGARGTPVVFLNGWRYPGAPADAEFRQAVDDLLAGKAPYEGFPPEAVRAQSKEVARR
jgi:hypothetical protein